jgi:hypothetical protein
MTLNKSVAALALTFCLVFLVGVALVLGRFEAEGMSEASTGISSVNDNGTQSLKFAVVGDYAQKGITLASPTESIEVRARTSISQNTRPTLRFFVDGQAFSNSVMDLKAGDTYATASEAVSIPAGSHTVYVKCVRSASTADTTDGDCNSQRNAFIDWISFSANDADEDGVADASDNCPNAANAPQADLDGDGQGDVCDADIDGDGRPNDTDYDPHDPSIQDPPASGCDVTITNATDVQNTGNGAPTGSVVCLRDGVYTDPDQEFRFTNAVTLKSYPGELAELRGSIHPMEGAAGFVLGDKGAEWPEGDGLRIDLSYGVQKVFSPDKCPLGCDTYNTEPIHWDSDGGGIYANDISNRDPSGDTARAGMGILMAGNTTDVVGTEIDGNYLHHCGQIPRNNHEHCMYLSHLRDGTVTDNLIYDSADRGIQNYSSPPNIVESGNLVVATHDTGVNACGGATDISMHNNVVVLSGNDDFTTCPAYNGSANSFTDNCTWMADGTSGIVGTDNVTVADNVTVDPQLQADWSTGTAKVANPACAAKLPPGSRFLP